LRIVYRFGRIEIPVKIPQFRNPAIPNSAISKFSKRPKICRQSPAGISYCIETQRRLCWWHL